MSYKTTDDLMVEAPLTPARREKVNAALGYLTAFYDGPWEEARADPRITELMETMTPLYLAGLHLLSAAWTHHSSILLVQAIKTFSSLDERFIAELENLEQRGIDISGLEGQPGTLHDQIETYMNRARELHSPGIDNTTLGEEMAQWAREEYDREFLESVGYIPNPD